MKDRIEIEGETYIREGSMKVEKETKKDYKRWRAEKGEVYYTIHNIDDCIYRYNDYYDTIDDKSYRSGNYYRTEELAKKALDKQLAIVRVNERIRELNQGEEGCCLITYDKTNTEFTYYYNTYIQYSGLLDCDGSEIARQIIKEHQEDLELIFNIE